MSTLKLAKEKYARKTKVMGPNWKAGVTGKEGLYGKGMAGFLGIPKIRDSRITAFKDGTDDVSAADFTDAVKGKEEVWGRRLAEAMSPV